MPPTLFGRALTPAAAPDLCPTCANSQYLCNNSEGTFTVGRGCLNDGELTSTQRRRCQQAAASRICHGHGAQVVDEHLLSLQ